MQEHFADRLTRLCALRGPVCAGIDPRLSMLPVDLDTVDWSEQTASLLGSEVAAVKPQLAFFGDDWDGPERVARAAAAGGALTIADCKRGDIGSTADAYAERILGPASPLDAATINPYLGSDSLLPFLRTAAANNRGLFVLVKTSNPGAADIQDLRLSGGGTVCERVAEMVDSLGAEYLGACGRSLLGAVVGLTAPTELVRRLRELMPRAFFLMPGYGAQGGDAATLEAALDENRGGVLVSASRSLTLPWQGQAPVDWRQRVASALSDMREELSGRTK